MTETAELLGAIRENTAEQRRANELLADLLVEAIGIAESLKPKGEPEGDHAATSREMERAKCHKCKTVYFRPRGNDDGNDCGQC